MHPKRHEPDEPSPHERSNAMLCHLMAFAGFVFPFGSIVGPLIVWLAQKEKSEFIDRHGREAINFQVTVMLLSAGATLLLLMPVVRFVFQTINDGSSVSEDDLPIAGILMGAAVLVLITLLDIVMTIVAAVKANAGKTFRYPLTLRLL